MHLALLVGTLVALLLASFILLVHLTSIFGLKLQKTNTLIEDVNQKALKLIDEKDFKYGDTLEFNNLANNNKTHVSYYGCWSKMYVAHKNEVHHFSKTLLVGNRVLPNVPNLYLKNTNSPLVLVGSATLQGTISLPKQGVKAGTINGNYYQKKQLVFGRSVYSKSELPALDPKWVSYLKQLQETDFAKTEISKSIRDVKQSFKKPSKLIYKASSITLNQGEIHGNVIIKSATSITVNKDVSLIDVILIAPKIKIRDHVEGAFQAIANEQIEVGENCKLHFPSSLVVLQTQVVNANQFNEVAIEIGADSVVEGSVVFISEKSNITANNRKRRRGVSTHLKINTNANIKGEVYCKGNVELLGIIKGSCYANKFVANQFGSKYINHIYNGEIRPFAVNKYAGIPFKKTNIKSVVKWLY